MNNTKKIIGVDIAKRVFQLHWIGHCLSDFEVTPDSERPSSGRLQTFGYA